MFWFSDAAKESQLNRIALGTSGLLLGLLFLGSFTTRRKMLVRDELWRHVTGIKIFRRDSATCGNETPEINRPFLKDYKDIRGIFCYRCCCNIASLYHLLLNHREWRSTTIFVIIFIKLPRVHVVPLLLHRFVLKFEEKI